VCANTVKYDLACIAKLGLYLHTSIGWINFSGLTLRNERSWQLPKKKKKKTRRENEIEPLSIDVNCYTPSRIERD